MFCRQSILTLLLVAGLANLLLGQMSFKYIDFKPEEALGIFDVIEDPKYRLDQREVKDIIQDRHGFIWVANMNGLYRLDGHDIVVYRENPMDPNSIVENNLEHLTEDEDGIIWIGTRSSGLIRFDPQLEKFSSFPGSDPPFKKVMDLIIDRKGRLWVGSATRGLFRFNRHSGAYHHYPHLKKDSTSLGFDLVTGLAEDKNGHIWIGTGGGGISQLDPETGQFVHFDDPERWAADFNRIVDVEADRRGYIWFTDQDADFSLTRVDPDTYQMQTYELPPGQSRESLRSIYISKILFDREEKIWLGTQTKGLFYLDPESAEMTVYQHHPLDDHSLASNHVISLMLDKSGILWAGGYGLSKIVTRSRLFEVLPFSFAGRQITNFSCIFEDSQGMIWAGTWKQGVYIYDPRSGELDSLKHITGMSTALASNMIWDIMEDREGFIWLATHNGLQRYDRSDGSFHTYGPESGTHHKAIRSLHEDHSGRLWVGTFGGLHWLDRENHRMHFVDPMGNSVHPIVTEMREDRKYDLWVATVGEGVYRRNFLTGQWTNFRPEEDHPESLSSNLVWAIEVDQQGRVWLGTEGKGLQLYEPGDPGGFRHWRPYNSDLPEETIYEISADAHQRLWLSTDLGLFLFDTRSEQFRSFSFPGKIFGFNVRVRPRSVDQLFAGNSEFIYQFHPDSLQQNKAPPPVFITGLGINGEEVSVHNQDAQLNGSAPVLRESILLASSLNLAYWQNDLSFQFTALNYIHPELNQYRFKLDGYDQDWKNTDPTQRIIRYTNLSPGKYRFQVQAANNDGIWNVEGRSLLLTIAFPWWATWWAYFLYAVAGLSLIAGIRHFELSRRLAKAEAQKQEALNHLQTRLYTNITHEFRTPLTIILGLAELMKNQVSEQVKNNLQLIQRNGRQLLKLVNQMLDLAKLDSGYLQLDYEQGDIITYLQYLLESFHSYAESKQIRLHFLSDLRHFPMDYDAVRLMHVVSNLLSNAVKFTPEGKDIYLSVHLVQSLPPGDQRLEIKVKDTGIGIPSNKLPFIFDRFFQADQSSSQASAGTGIGLTLTRELVALMGGQIQVKSELGKGSEFTVVLPVTNKAEIKMRRPAPQPLPLAHRDTDTFVAIRNGEKPVLLIVEDNPDLVKYLISCFQRDYHLEVAFNGQQGIEKARAQIPDIIITDVMMPEKDGFELTAFLKNHELTSHIPIIMLTAKAEVEARLTGLSRGADAYLEKPFLQEELRVRIQTLLKQRKDLQAYYTRKFHGQQSPLPHSLSEADRETEHVFLSKIDALISENLSNSAFSVKELSEALYVSNSNLYRKMKALTGDSPNEYIRRYRLAKAKSLLIRTNQSVALVAYESGFADPRYFSRIFKKEIGMAPSKFRNEKK